MDNKTLRVCLAASAGGHLTQLLKLSDSWCGHDIFFVTTTEVGRQTCKQYGIVYVAGEGNHKHPIRVIKVILSCIKIAFKEDFNVVISTGAAAGCLMCFLGKIKGAKVIWIDSVTNVTKMSLSGRMTRYIADLYIAQWPQFAKKNKNVEYVGTIV